MTEHLPSSLGPGPSTPRVPAGLGRRLLALGMISLLLLVPLAPAGASPVGPLPAPDATGEVVDAQTCAQFDAVRDEVVADYGEQAARPIELFFGLHCTPGLVQALLAHATVDGQRAAEPSCDVSSTRAAAVELPCVPEVPGTPGQDEVCAILASLVGGVQASSAAAAETCVDVGDPTEDLPTQDELCDTVRSFISAPATTRADLATCVDVGDPSELVPSEDEVCAMVQSLVALETLTASAMGPMASSAALVVPPGDDGTGAEVCGEPVERPDAFIWLMIAAMLESNADEVGGALATASTTAGTAQELIVGAPANRPPAPEWDGPIAAAGGSWQVIIGKGYLTALDTTTLDSGDAVTQTGVTVPLDIPDNGWIRQTTTKDIPAGPLASNWKEASTTAQRAWAWTACGISVIGYGASVAAFVAAPNPVTFGVMALGAVSAGDSCGNAANVQKDNGYYHCHAQSGSVTWGGETNGADGNMYDGGGALLTLPFTSSSSHDGRQQLPFDYPATGDPTSYSNGKRLCQEAYDAFVDEINTAAKEFEPTLGDEAYADLTIHVDAGVATTVVGSLITTLEDGAGAPVADLIQVVGQPVPAVVAYCAPTCPVNLDIHVSDCGMGQILIGQEGPVYTFEGSGACFKIAVYANGGTVVPPTAVPALSLDGEFDGANTNTAGAGGVSLA